MVAAVVAALTQAASSAAGAAGTALGVEAVDWVRQGLGQLPRWTQAAERADSAPEDAEAKQRLAEAVNELLSLNPALAQALAARLEQLQRPVEAPPAPPGPPTVNVGEGARVGGAGQAAVGLGNVLVGGDVHNKTVVKRSSVGIVITVLVIVAGLIALGIHYLGGPGLNGAVPRIPASVEGAALRATTTADHVPEWDRFRDSLTKNGLENPQMAAYGVVPNVFSDQNLGGDEHEARWMVVIAGSTTTFQRVLSEAQANPSDTRLVPVMNPGKKVPTSLPGAMYCSATGSQGVREGDDYSCMWTDDKYVIMVDGVGQDPMLSAAVIERIYHGTEH
ncbi:hypothetical protein ACH4E7_18865 [Kitasatospora sp. NPDC018058]|uniref:hypothetical protein n=1 Tax=Kitasatospora sp. NPDC018058 TaxID=3364025 RepID=UPI0037C16EDF